MKLQGVDTVIEIAIFKRSFVSRIIKFCHFATFLMPPCCPVFQRNQYDLKSFSRE